MLCAGLCWVKGSHTTRKTHFKVPTAMGASPTPGHPSGEQQPPVPGPQCGASPAPSGTHCGGVLSDVWINSWVLQVLYLGESL